MPHSIKEHHLDDICSNCKKPHGKDIELLRQHHKIYEVNTCVNCGYKILKIQHEKQFSNRFEFM